MLLYKFNWIWYSIGLTHRSLMQNTIYSSFSNMAFLQTTICYATFESKVWTQSMWWRKCDCNSTSIDTESNKLLRSVDIIRLHSFYGNIEIDVFHFKIWSRFIHLLSSPGSSTSDGGVTECKTFASFSPNLSILAKIPVGSILEEKKYQLKHFDEKTGE